MKQAILVAGLLIFHCGEMLADECDAKAAELAAREGVTVGKRTAAGQIPMQHPNAPEIVIECGPAVFYQATVGGKNSANRSS